MAVETRTVCDSCGAFESNTGPDGAARWRSVLILDPARPTVDGAKRVDGCSAVHLAEAVHLAVGGQGEAFDCEGCHEVRAALARVEELEALADNLRRLNHTLTKEHTDTVRALDGARDHRMIVERERDVLRTKIALIEDEKPDHDNRRELRATIAELETQLAALHGHVAVQKKELERHRMTYESMGEQFLAGAPVESTRPRPPNDSISTLASVVTGSARVRTGVLGAGPEPDAVVISEDEIKASIDGRRFCGHEWAYEGKEYSCTRSPGHTGRHLPFV